MLKLVWFFDMELVDLWLGVGPYSFTLLFILAAKTLSNLGAKGGI
jgi:hypothetical protein